MAALQGAVLSQSTAQMASNYYYNPSSSIGSKGPAKALTERIHFPMLLCSIGVSVMGFYRREKKKLIRAHLSPVVLL